MYDEDIEGLKIPSLVSKVIYLHNAQNEVIVFVRNGVVLDGGIHDDFEIVVEIIGNT